MATFDPNSRGYDPALRPYRVAVYVVVLGVILWLCTSFVYSILDWFL